MGSKRFMPVLIIGGIILIALYFKNKNAKELNKSHRYTIGTITKREFGLTKAYVYFYFSFKEKIEDAFYQLDSNEKNRSKRYDRFIVEFNPGDLDNNKILFEYPITDDSLSAPIDGWLSIPDTIQFIPLEE